MSFQDVYRRPLPGGRHGSDPPDLPRLPFAQLLAQCHRGDGNPGGRNQEHDRGMEVPGMLLKGNFESRLWCKKRPKFIGEIEGTNEQ